GLHPMLAEWVPTRENGDWVLNPDGTMLTTFKLRPNIRWHDGVPLTAQDLAFAYQVFIDPSLAFRSELEKRMSSVETTDDHTVKITWSEPYAFASALGMQDLAPLPRHLLE